LARAVGARDFDPGGEVADVLLVVLQPVLFLLGLTIQPPELDVVDAGRDEVGKVALSPVFMAPLPPAALTRLPTQNMR